MKKLKVSKLKLSQLQIENAMLNMAVATLFFSFMQVIVKYLQDLPFFQLVFFRAFVSLIFAFGALKIAKVSLKPKNIKWVFIRGVAGTLSLMAYFYSLQKLPLTTAVTLQYLSPIFSVLWAALFFNEKATFLQWFFLLASFFGVYIGKGLDGSLPIFDISIGILAAALSGMSYNAIRQLKDSDPPLRVVFYFPFMTVLFSAPFAFHGWIWPDFQQWLLILALGLVTWVAQIFMTKGYQTGLPGVVNIVGYTGIFYAAFFGYFLFDETLTLNSSFGILIIIASVLASTYFSSKKKEVLPGN